MIAGALQWRAFPQAGSAHGAFASQSLVEFCSRIAQEPADAAWPMHSYAAQSGLGMELTSQRTGQAAA